MIGTREGADSFHANNPDWLGLSITQKDDALAIASLYLNSGVKWKGAITDPSQSDSWPRTGVVDTEGRSIPSDSTPEAIIQAAYLLANLEANNQSLTTSIESPERLTTSETVAAKGVSVSESYGSEHRFTGQQVLSGITPFSRVNLLIAPYVQVTDGGAGRLYRRC